MLKVRECHKVKVWPPFFEAVLSGDKTFEVRKDDRDYRVGDSLLLCEWSPDADAYTGLFANFRIVYKLDGGQFGIEKGYCCLGIAPISKAAESAQTDNQQLKAAIALLRQADSKYLTGVNESKEFLMHLSSIEQRAAV
jgi:hypothetical protein